MRIPLLTLGSRGDVQPYAQLARVLQRRGHDVVLGAPANFADLAAALDVPFAPIADDFEALTQRPDARLALPATEWGRGPAREPCGPCAGSSAPPPP